MPSRSIFARALLCNALFALPSQAADHSIAATRVSVAATPPRYRAYAGTQAEMLVRMTNMLATDIRDGNVAAAQNDYAATHRYLGRIQPALALQPGLARRMDAAADEFVDKERDPAFSGFHRIEHALFARHSTTDLSATADRLHEDALQLQKAVATQIMPPDMLIDGAVEMISVRLDGDREPYSKTDLWDIEANVEGAREIVASIRPRIEARDPFAMARLATAFAAASARLAQFPDGCGFKSFDELSRADKAGLEATMSALTREIAKLKAAPAID